MPNPVPNIFQNRTGSIPLLDLDTNFASLQSLTANSGASKIGVYDSAAHFASDDVEGVLAELWTYADNSRDRANHIGTQLASSISDLNTATVIFSNKSIDLGANTITGTTVQFNAALTDGDFATLAGIETLTNKSIDLGTNTVTGTTAQFNTALSDGDFATLAGAETLTNKTINLTSNTLTGTTAQFNTALSDGDFATLAGSETLTNKTINLTSNTLTGTTAQFNTALSDGDFATLAGTETLTNKRVVPRVVALTAGLTIASNADTTDLGWVVITQNCTISNPTGTPTDGQKIVYRVKQDATGGWTVAWDTLFRFAGGVAPTQTATIAKTDYYEFTYNGADTKWDMTDITQNL